MEHDPLTQRDLDAINARFDAMASTLERIEHKQDYTNGRVGALERTNIYVRGFMGAIAVVVGIPAIVGSILAVVLGLQKLFE